MPHVIIAGSIHASGLETLKRRSDFTFEYLVESTDNSYVKYLVKADALILRTQPLLRKDIEMGMKLLELLVNNKIMSSKSEARRAINNKGVKINDILVADENKTLNSSDFKDENLKISFGKKKHFLFKIT